MANPFLDKAATAVTKTVVDSATPALRVTQRLSTTAQTIDSTAPNFINKSFQGAGGKSGGGGASGSWDEILPVASYSNEGRSVPTLKEMIPAYGNEGRSVPTLKSLATPASTSASGSTNDEEQGRFGYKVRLFAVRGFPSERVIFEVSPTVSESRSVEYSPVSPVHMPGSIQVYKRTGSRSFSIGAKFVSRNIAQATQNMQYLQTLRGWTMPYFGLRTHLDATLQNKDTGPMLGAPPDVLYLYAYSDASGANNDRDGAFQTNLKKIPVVITNLSFDYPEDVDYIPTASGDPFPVKMEVKIDLAETHSPKGYEEFSLSLFKQGKLVQF